MYRLSGEDREQEYVQCGRFDRRAARKHLFALGGRSDSEAYFVIA